MSVYLVADERWALKTTTSNDDNCCLRQKQNPTICFHTISVSSFDGMCKVLHIKFISDHFNFIVSLIRYRIRHIISAEKSDSMGPKKDTKGGKGKGKEPKDASDGDDKSKGNLGKWAVVFTRPRASIDIQL